MVEEVEAEEEGREGARSSESHVRGETRGEGFSPLPLTHKLQKHAWSHVDAWRTHVCLEVVFSLVKFSGPPGWCVGARVVSVGRPCAVSPAVGWCDTLRARGMISRLVFPPPSARQS